MDWENVDIANNEVSLLRNGNLQRKGTALKALEHPLIPLTWLANELSRTGIGMKTGQLVSTGTLTGMLMPKKAKPSLQILVLLGKASGTYK
jgi:2-keto-4-pentenoate hydratase